MVWPNRRSPLHITPVGSKTGRRKKPSRDRALPRASPTTRRAPLGDVLRFVVALAVKPLDRLGQVLPGRCVQMLHSRSRGPILGDAHDAPSERPASLRVTEPASAARGGAEHRIERTPRCVSEERRLQLSLSLIHI